MAAEITVVIVTFNSSCVVGALLDSLPPALAGIAADVVVVDNGSTDGTADLVTARGDCRVIRSANVGYAAGINRGVADSAPTRGILVLNADVRLHKAAVPPLLAALGEPGVGIVAPQVRSATGRLELSLRREPTLPRAIGLTRTGLPAFSEYVAGWAAYARPAIVDWALGAVLLISRRCYDLLGGLDESFFLYSEETDLSLRARDAGMLTRYEPASVATHLGGQSGRSPATHAMQIINRVRLYRRRHRRAASVCYFLVTLASELSRIPRGHRESWTAVVALLFPARRPAGLYCSRHLIPH